MLASDRKMRWTLRGHLLRPKDMFFPPAVRRMVAATKHDAPLYEKMKLLRRSALGHPQ